MTGRIRHLCSTSELILAWQAPDSAGDRFRWAVGTVTRVGSEFRLRYLQDQATFGPLNQGRQLSKLRSMGYRGYPGFASDQAEHELGVREAFMRRLPDRARQDFPEFLEGLCLTNYPNVDDLTLLGTSEGVLPSDGFSFTDPLDFSKSACDHRIEIAGFRYYQPKLASPLAEGAILKLRHEVGNEFDPRAIVVERDGEKIGNLNRLQTAVFHSWIRADRLDVSLDRLNGSSAKPRAYMLVHVRPPAVDLHV